MFNLLECSASLVSSSTTNNGAAAASSVIASVFLVVSVFGRLVLRSIWLEESVGTGSSILMDSWTRATQAGFPYRSLKWQQPNTFSQSVFEIPMAQTFSALEIMKNREFC